MKLKYFAAAFCFLAVILLSAFQWKLADNFCENPDRIEISGVRQGPELENFLSEADENYRCEHTGDSVILFEKAADFHTFSAKQAESMLEKNGVQYISLNDYSFAEKLAKQFLSIDIFFIQCSAVVILIKMLISVCRKSVRSFKAWGKDLYISDIFKKYTAEILEMVLKVCLLSFAVLYCAAEIIAFVPFVPYKYVPPEYILDFKFYLNAFQGNRYIAVSEYGEIYAQFMNLSTVITAAVFVLLAAATAIIIKKEKHHGKDSV